MGRYVRICRTQAEAEDLAAIVVRPLQKRWFEPGTGVRTKPVKVALHYPHPDVPHPGGWEMEAYSALADDQSVEDECLKIWREAGLSMDR